MTGDPPFPALARSGSGFVACWQEYPRRWHPRIACARAPNGGSWSRPGVVAQPPRAGDAAQPALAAGPDGRIWLAFYRHGRRSTSVELWSARNAAAPWRPRGVLLRAPVPGSMLDFLGDYQGLAVGRTYGIAAFTLPSASHAFRQVIGVARFPTSRL